MSIALFAIIGAKLNMGMAYWITFSGYCVWKTTKCFIKFLQATKE